MVDAINRFNDTTF